jgi:hypothetical protein
MLNSTAEQHRDTLAGTWSLMDTVRCPDSTRIDGRVAVTLLRVGDGWRVLDFRWLPQSCTGGQSFPGPPTTPIGEYSGAVSPQRV